MFLTLLFSLCNLGINPVSSTINFKMYDIFKVDKNVLGNIQILRNPPRGGRGVSQMITKDYGGGGGGS